LKKKSFLGNQDKKKLLLTSERIAFDFVGPIPGIQEIDATAFSSHFPR